jgi:hypothetical protein
MESRIENLAIVSAGYNFHRSMKDNTIVAAWSLKFDCIVLLIRYLQCIGFRQICRLIGLMSTDSAVLVLCARQALTNR